MSDYSKVTSEIVRRSFFFFFLEAAVKLGQALQWFGDAFLHSVVVGDCTVLGNGFMAGDSQINTTHTSA